MFIKIKKHKGRWKQIWQNPTWVPHLPDNGLAPTVERAWWSATAKRARRSQALEDHLRKSEVESRENQIGDAILSFGCVLQKKTPIRRHPTPNPWKSDNFEQEFYLELRKLLAHLVLLFNQSLQQVSFLLSLYFILLLYTCRAFYCGTRRDITKSFYAGDGYCEKHEIILGDKIW